LTPKSLQYLEKGKNKPHHTPHILHTTHITHITLITHITYNTQHPSLTKGLQRDLGDGAVGAGQLGLHGPDGLRQPHKRLHVHLWMVMVMGVCACGKMWAAWVRMALEIVYSEYVHTDERTPHAYIHTLNLTLRTEVVTVNYAPFSMQNTSHNTPYTTYTTHHTLNTWVEAMR